MFSKIKIGDFAKLNHISIQTLRYYESIDLLNPFYIDSDSNYRYYKISQSATLDTIQFLKQLDFSLNEIKHILTEDNPTTNLKHIMEEQQTYLVKQQHLIEQKIKSINSFQDGLTLFEKKNGKYEIEFTQLPKRYILTYEIDENIYSISHDEYELWLRKFRNHINESNLSIDIFNRVGSLMPRENFLKTHISSKKLFIFCPDSTYSNDSLKKGLYAVYYCPSFEEEPAYIDTFKEELVKLNYQIIGDYICEIVYEQNITNSFKRDMFIRMQIPVKEI